MNTVPAGLCHPIAGEHPPFLHPDALRFFALLNWQPGHVETTGNRPTTRDSNKIEQVRGSQRFSYVRPDAPHTAANVLQRCAVHVADGYDPFVSVHSYRTKDRDPAKAQPGRVLFVDDWQPAPGRLTPNFVLQTSPNSYHAFFVVDLPDNQRLSQHEYLELATRAAAAMGGDPSGVDLTQLTRVPGTVNSKAKHGGWIVTLHIWRAQPYTLAELRAAWPTVARTAPAQPQAANMPPADWSHLAGSHGAALLQSARWQGLIRARSQLTQLIHHRQRVTLTRSTGAPDDSDSAQVACFVFNTISARSKTGEHVPVDEIRAVALALQPDLWPGYTDAAAFAARIDHEIVRYMPKASRNPVPTRLVAGRAAVAPAAAQPLAASATKQASKRAGRIPGQAETTIRAVYRVLQAIEPSDGSMRCYLIADLAARIDRSVSTVRNALRVLHAEGMIAGRGQEGGSGGRAYAILSVDLGVQKITAPHSESTPIVADSRGAVTCDESRSTTLQTNENEARCNKDVGKTLPQPCRPAATPAPEGAQPGGSVLPLPQEPASGWIVRLSCGRWLASHAATGSATWHSTYTAAVNSTYAALVLVVTPEPVLVEPVHDLPSCASYDPAYALLPYVPPQPRAVQRQASSGSQREPRRKAINQARRARNKSWYATQMRGIAVEYGKDFDVLVADFPYLGPKLRLGKQQRMKLV